jgi:putative transposase
VVIY